MTEKHKSVVGGGASYTLSDTIIGKQDRVSCIIPVLRKLKKRPMLFRSKQQVVTVSAYLK